jgi:transcription antitermination factor NusG
MGTLNSQSTATSAYPSVDSQAANWHALHTCSRHEKHVAIQLERRHVEFFLPLYSSIRRWSDRRVELQLPLFPGYLFVRLAPEHRIDILNLAGAVRFVAFQGRPAVIPESELLRLRNGLEDGRLAEPHPYLTVGRRVRVRTGPMEGLEGILVRKKDRYRLVLSIDIIMRSVAVEVGASDVEPIP